MMHVLLFTMFYSVLGEYISLNGKWTLINSTMSGISASVPGGVHTALMGARILGDPYYRKNDAAYSWVGRGNWQYTRTFKVPNETQKMDMILLVCEGLDTIATVRINDKVVGKSDNMFVRYIYDIKHVVKATNIITIDFKSPVKYGEERANASSYNIPPDCPPYYFHGECHRNMVRKMQCSFSWDWGPAFVTMGIWKDIYIQATDRTIITDVTTETNKKPHDGTWTLHVNMSLRSSHKIDKDGLLEVAMQDTSFLVTRSVNLYKGLQTLSEKFEIPKTMGINQWWPRGYGLHTMYNLTVMIKAKLDIVLAKKTIRFAFRTVQLVEDPEPVSAHGQDGLSFYFRINDRPIFLKGSNWIPADSFPERVTKERLRNYLQSAVDANMNCLRVWGGGIYESDYFYDLADEFGILIWQDFMFACALYPTDEEFLSSVKEEVTHQVRRLKNHPSVFAYSGNNENEVAIAGYWWAGIGKRSKSDYVKLYIDTIQKIVREIDPSRPYMISSPSNGYASTKEGGLSSDPGSTRYGDIHFYDYRGAFFEDYTYKIPRMASEYGKQSFPSIESLATAYGRQDFSYTSDLNNYRQHHSGGNYEMEQFIATYMKPPNSNVEHQRFADIIYCTQIVQAIAMRTETEHYRRWQSRVNDYGEGKTMGALYWMFADIWQAPSWGSIEYGGKWKMLHYYAMYFFSPVLISPFISKNGNDNHLEIYIVVDELSEFQKTEHLDGHNLVHLDNEHDITSKLFAERYPNWQKQSLLDLLKEKILGKEEALSLYSGIVYMRVYSWDSLNIKYTERLDFRLFKPAELVYKISVNNLVLKSGCGSAEKCVVVLYIGDINDGHSTWYPLTTFKQAIGLREPDLKVELIRTTEDHNVFELQLTTDAIAPFVWLEARGIKGRFSDNGFLMFLPRKTILFYAWEATDVSTLTVTVTIKSLMNIYD